jgi:flagellum-specific ATP synthase
VQVGAYEAGTNPELDDAIRLRAQMVTFLQQDMHLGEDYQVTRNQLRQLLS